MKAALNGALNLSILDGWWNEYFDGGNGWAIPSADRAHDGAERDALEATALYDLIENRIAPRFYERDADGVPAGWVHDIRHTLRTLSPELSADRMVRQYVERLYVPAGRAQRIVAADDHARARGLAAWRGRVEAAWPSVQVAHVESEGVGQQAQVGDELRVRAWVALGGLSPEDVTVEVVHGRTGEGDVLVDVVRHELQPVGGSGGQQEYAGSVRLPSAGPFGYTVRVVPRHELLASSAEPGLVAAAKLTAAARAGGSGRATGADQAGVAVSFAASTSAKRAYPLSFGWLSGPIQPYGSDAPSPTMRGMYAPISNTSASGSADAASRSAPM
jgi:starch phosphorylase